jgi:hypothetical protein
MEKITDILFCEIENEDGRRLGRLYDLRSDGEPEHGLSKEQRLVTEIIYGTTGLWEMLGLKKTDFKTISWKAVRKIESGKIIIERGK